MVKTLKGYVSSRSINLQIVPQSIQNILLRNYCIENNFKLALSATEYSPDKSFLMLEQTINEIKNYDGIISYSIFQLPQNINYRTQLLNDLITKKKIFYFVLEKISFKSKSDLKYLNQIFKINQLLPNCIKKI